MGVTRCAFCGGRGKDPFNLLSKLAACQVCLGRGQVKVYGPAIGCAFCKGSGIHPHRRLTCSSCKGKGRITFRGVGEECPDCHGHGRAVDGNLPCSRCGGKGVIDKS